MRNLFKIIYNKITRGKLFNLLDLGLHQEIWKMKGIPMIATEQAINAHATSDFLGNEI